jgi:hypothetical protein
MSEKLVTREQVEFVSRHRRAVETLSLGLPWWLLRCVEGRKAYDARDRGLNRKFLGKFLDI